MVGLLLLFLLAYSLLPPCAQNAKGPLEPPTAAALPCYSQHDASAMARAPALRCPQQCRKHLGERKTGSLLPSLCDLGTNISYKPCVLCEHRSVYIGSGASVKIHCMILGGQDWIGAPDGYRSGGGGWVCTWLARSPLTSPSVYQLVLDMYGNAHSWP